MDAHIDVVKRAANSGPGLPDGLVARTLFARRVLGLLGAALVLFSLTATLAVSPSASEETRDALPAARSLAMTAARSGKAVPRPPRGARRRAPPTHRTRITARR